jgi:hypothetical protein
MEGGALTDVIDNNPSISEDQIATICFEVSTLPRSRLQLILIVNRLARALSICTTRISFIATSRVTTSCLMAVVMSKSV